MVTVCMILILISMPYMPRSTAIIYASNDHPVELEDNDEDDQSEEETNDNTSEVEDTQIMEDTIEPLAISDGSVEVGSWDDLLTAMENAAVREILITSDFTASGLITKEYPVSGDKIIEGKGNTIDFFKHRFDIGGYVIKVKDLKIQVNQYNTGNPKASVFYSGVEGTLILENSSFDGIQHGQAVKMKKGHIKIAGEVNIRTKGPYEVFEAKDITFMEGSQFLGETTESGSYRKETLNLYNNPTITVEKNASVVLKTESREAVINELDSSKAVINIGENAMFQVYADHIKTSQGKDLIHLPGTESSITVGKDATFDIQNHREGSELGSVINMNGTLTTHEEGGKLAYWKKGSNTDEPSGLGYTVFPRVMGGELDLSADIINEARANPATALAESENEDENGKLFRDVLTDKDTSDVKRLHITDAGKPKAPKVDTFTENDNTLTGIATPGIEIEISDSTGQIWKTVADKETGEFSVKLGEYEPYEAGEQLSVIAIDPYDVTSAEASIPVIGITLVFQVPGTLNFKQTMVKDEETIIARMDEDWSIDVKNTRGAGSEWGVTAKVEKPLENENGHKLGENALVFVKDGESQSLKDSVSIGRDEAGEKRDTVIKWGGNEGILLQLNPVESGVEVHTEYTTTIEWTLTDAPS